MLGLEERSNSEIADSVAKVLVELGHRIRDRIDAIDMSRGCGMSGGKGGGHGGRCSRRSLGCMGCTGCRGY